MQSLFRILGERSRTIREGFFLRARVSCTNWCKNRADNVRRARSDERHVAVGKIRSVCLFLVASLGNPPFEMGTPNLDGCKNFKTGFVVV